MDSLSPPYLTVPNPSAPAPSLARLYARPGFLLRRVHQISAAVFEDECRAVGLTPAQFGVMTVLRATPGLDQSSLARALGFDKVTVLRVLRGLESRGQVAVRYNDNYNGSQNAIAGICDASGLVFGLMPHPERFLEWNRHPWWTRLDAGTRGKETPGLLMFRNAVEAVAGAGV